MRAGAVASKRNAHFQDVPACALETLSQARSRGPRYHVPAATKGLAAVARALTVGARACFRRLLESLHESRRRQAAIERARYRHLIFDPETGIFFGNNSGRQKTPPAE
jgi:hypothetical protein